MEMRSSFEMRNPRPFAFAMNSGLTMWRSTSDTACSLLRSSICTKSKSDAMALLPLRIASRTRRSTAAFWSGVMRFGNGISARFLARRTRVLMTTSLSLPAFSYHFFSSLSMVPISFLHFFDFVTQLSCMLEVLLFDCFFQFRTFLFNRRGFFHNGNLTCRFHNAQRIASGYFAAPWMRWIVGIRRSRNTL